MNPAYPCKVHAYDSCGAQVERLHPGMTYRELVAKDVLIEYIRSDAYLSQKDAARAAAQMADMLIAVLSQSTALPQSNARNGGNP